MTPRTGTLFWLPLILHDKRLDPTETLLLVAIADHIDAEDTAFPGMKLLADMARVSYPTARRRLASLEERGVIKRDRRRRDDGNLSTYTYTLSREWFGQPVINLITDHGSPGRALTSDHPGERAEVPSDEQPSGQTPLSTDVDARVVSDDEQFAIFWDAYPARNGKKIGKRLTRAGFLRLSLAERRTAYRGAVNYAAATAAGVAGGMDPERFLKHRVWEDWQEPATISSAAVARSRKRMTLEERVADKAQRLFGDREGTT